MWPVSEGRRGLSGCECVVSSASSRAALRKDIEGVASGGGVPSSGCVTCRTHVTGEGSVFKWVMISGW